jgi:hypothetical protein
MICIWPLLSIQAMLFPSGDRLQFVTLEVFARSKPRPLMGSKNANTVSVRFDSANTHTCDGAEAQWYEYSPGSTTVWAPPSIGMRINREDDAS